MIYSILYILLNVILYIDIGVARALYVAVVVHSIKNINILLYVSLCAPYFVILSTRSIILNTRSVILNAVKNLEVSVAVDGSASLEILRYTQDDIAYEEILRYTQDYIEPTMARRCFDFAQHDILREITLCCHSERSEESRGLRGGGRQCKP